MKNKENKNKDNQIKQEMKQYKAGYSIFNKFPMWLTALLLKYWFFGAVYFFLGFGVGLPGYWFALAAGLGGGAFYDIIVRHILNAIDAKNEAKYHVMCSAKKYYSFPVNIVYCLGLFYLGVTVALLLKMLFGQTVTFGQEPLSFALIMIVCDVMCMLVKWGVLVIVSHIKGTNKKVDEANAESANENK